MKMSELRLNRLAREKSPYLLQHRANPVDWFPWGDEAFEKARSENKPIFLSVGYSTCHWCHVMEHESFENQGIADFLNRHFVSIKVDREERPDVDRVYMTFVQATTGSGGWPMSVWLTPELEPFFGGTYFPPEDRWGRPGFLTMLERIIEAWQLAPEKLREHGQSVIASLREQAEVQPGGKNKLDDGPVKSAVASYLNAFDGEYGGYGDAPKFPRPSVISLMHRAGGEAGLHTAVATLDAMARGGMHDQLGGGFHRYSVDRFWHVPHFEKMLYDQAQLAVSYLEAWQITGEERHAGIVRRTLDYVLQDMTSPEGAFFSAEDADSLFETGAAERGEGAFYVWKKSEIEAVLEAGEAVLFCKKYGVEEAGNSPQGSDPHDELTGRNTLIVRCELSEEEEQIVARAAAKLLKARAARPRPHLDDKIITAWNGLMISAFARAGAALADAGYVAGAARAAEFFLRQLPLARSWREGERSGDGFADDYAFFIQALIDLHETTGVQRWMDAAAELQREMHAQFSASGGGYFSARDDDPSILVRMKDDHDGAEPSSNSVAIMNLLRLHQHTGSPEFLEWAEAGLSAFDAHVHAAPTALPFFLCAWDFALGPARQVVITPGEGAEALWATVHKTWLPRTVLIHGDSEHTNAAVRAMAALQGMAAAYVCRDFTCQLPVTDPDALERVLTT